MSEPTHTVDASTAPIKEKPFPAPEIPMVDKPGDGGEDPVRAKSPRDEVLEGLHGKYEESVQTEIDSQTPEDYLAAGVLPPDPDERAEPPPGTQTAALPASTEQAVDPGEGGTPVQAMHPAQPAGNPLPTELQDNPLAPFIVMQGDVPMMKMNVNGQMVLKPLTEIQSAEQSFQAANVRHRENANWQKDLQAREQQLEQSRQLMQRPPASPPATADVNDDELLVKAKETISEMYSGDEDTAALKLVNFVKNLPQAQPAPQVNFEEIGRVAAATAKREIQEEGFQRAVDTGWEQFKLDYPDLATDRGLVRHADGLTDAIEAANPRWNPTQVMAEAGNQTRIWRDSFSTPEAPANPLLHRQERKQELTPLPPIKTGTPAPEPEEVEQTPSDYIAELRAGRGQD